MSTPFLGEFNLNQWGWIVPWAFGLSLVVFFGSLIGIWVILARLPVGYLNQTPSNQNSRRARPLVNFVKVIVRNVVGIAFLCIGLVMLVTPGQGLMSIVAGIILLDFPGKRKLIRKILGHPKVFSSINKLRHKSGRPPLDPPRVIESEPTIDKREP